MSRSRRRLCVSCECELPDHRIRLCIDCESFGDEDQPDTDLAAGVDYIDRFGDEA